jgi:hypothetical protein
MVDEAVERKPVDRVMRDVVAEPPYAGCVQASYDERPPVDRHTPLTAKHPLAKLIPLAKVEVAEVPVTFRYVASTPAPKVEVAEPSMVVVAVPPT